MNKLAAILSLCAACFCANADGFLFRTNPAPVVRLAWNPSTNSDVVRYTIYWGVGSRQYTNTSIWAALPTNNTATVTLPARGVTYYFAATATDTNGLQSHFSNEVTWTPTLPPETPLFQPVTVLTAQSAPDLLRPIWDDVFEVSLSEQDAKQFFRLKIQ